MKSIGYLLSLFVVVVIGLLAAWPFPDRHDHWVALLVSMVVWWLTFPLRARHFFISREKGKVE